MAADGALVVSVLLTGFLSKVSVVVRKSAVEDLLDMVLSGKCSLVLFGRGVCVWFPVRRPRWVLVNRQGAGAA